MLLLRAFKELKVGIEDVFFLEETGRLEVEKELKELIEP